jgi:hypothetical protein
VPRRPSRSACFQPDNYRNPELFADRETLTEHLTETLRCFLEPGAPGEARILVRGQRGIGKSMVSRRAIDRVVAELGPLFVEVDAARTGHGPEPFLRQLARALAQETLRNSTDPTLCARAELILELASQSKVQHKTARTLTKSAALNLKLDDKLTDFLGVELSVGLGASRAVTVEESAEHQIDVPFLQGIIQAFLVDALALGQMTILFIDNLDQVGYAEIEEDVRRVTDLARYLLSMDGCVVVANLRTEFVSADLRKLQSYAVELLGMSPAELMQVYEARVKARGGDARAKLEEAGMPQLAVILSEWTDNAWGFLCWLAYLDLQPLPDEQSPAALLALMRRYAETQYTGVTWEELTWLSGVYKSAPTKLWRTEDELRRGGLSEELIKRACKYGALVPDWLLSPDRYMLAPGLMFLIRG